MPLKSWPVQLIVMDLAAKVSGVLSLLLLAKGHAAEALYAAVALNVFAVARGVAGGRALEQGLARTWQELTEATCQHDLARLDAREQTEQWASLMEATGHVAHFRSIVCGRGASHALMLVVVAAYTGFVVGWHWVAAGAVAVAMAPNVIASGTS